MIVDDERLAARTGRTGRSSSTCGIELMFKDAKR